MILFVSLACILIVMGFVGNAQVAAQDKGAYQEEIEQRLHELERNIEALSAKAAHVEEASKSTFKQALSNLQAKQAEAQAQLERLKMSGGHAWEEVKAGVNNAVKDAQAAYDRAVARFQ